MSGQDPAASRVRRMLPSVSEVLRELTARAPIEPDVAFRAAREVCAEELKRIRDSGGESVPLAELVERALRRATPGAAPERIAVPARPAEPSIVFEPEPAPQAPETDNAVEDPFSETTGAMDLRWDRETREPFSEPHTALPPATEPAPSPAPAERPAAPETFPEAHPPATAERPLSFAFAPEEEVFTPAPMEAAPEAGPSPTVREGEGPGDETLSRLSKEAESIDLKSVFARGSEPSAVPYAVAPEEGLEPSETGRGTPLPPAFDERSDAVLSIPRGGSSRGGEGRGPRVGLILGVTATLVALAGLGYLLVGLWVERDAVPTPVAVARPRPVVRPSPLATISAMPSALSGGAVASPVPAVSASAPTSAPAVPTKVAPAAPTAPSTKTALPVSPVAPTAVAAPGAKVPAAGAQALPRSRDGLIVTPDRAGQAQVFSIHFTSYKDRASADRDLKRVSTLVGREGYVAEVDLGEKGVWYRVMIGEFATAQDAKSVRQELAAQGTPSLGWVYRVVGPETAGRP